jgi:hypothetical protein
MKPKETPLKKRNSNNQEKRGSAGELNVGQDTNQLGEVLFDAEADAKKNEEERPIHS